LSTLTKLLNLISLVLKKDETLVYAFL